MRFIAIICLCFALKGKAQYYVMAAPNVAFNTPLNDTKNLLGGTIEVGKYFGMKYHFQPHEVMVTFPVYDKFSVSAAIGYFYHHKDITMEYDFNYTIPMKKDYSFVLSYGAQSAFGGTFGAYSIGINKDLKIK